MIDVSVTVISKNEAHNIRECLRSVGWASEIIVVDQFSEDETVTIAEEFGAKIFRQAWHGFAKQKNFAIEKATCPWILSLDADERVTPALRQEIEDKLTKENKYNGYYIARKNFFCGKWVRHGGWYPDYTLRLFRKSHGNFENREVHEKIVVIGKVGYLKHPLEHFTYRSIQDFLLRLERYSRLAARELPNKNRWSISYSLCLKPLYTFMKMYLIRRGILDGTPGFFLAISYAYYTFLKYYRFYQDHFLK